MIRESKKLRDSRYRQKNRDKIRLKAALSYQFNPKPHNISARKYAKKNKEKISEYQRKYREKNKEKIRQQKTKYHKENREKILAAKRDESKRNLVKYSERSAAWRKANPDRRKAIANRWVKNHPEQGIKATHIRRARKIGVGGKFTHEDIREITKLQRNRCAICRNKLGVKRHIDHISPLSSGGRNDRKNIQITCPPCNQSKGAKDPIDFMRERGFLL